MTTHAFEQSLSEANPPDPLGAPLAALWWDAKADWAAAHALVDELTTSDGMAVHAYLHRKEGAEWNADYWYKRAGLSYRRELSDEWKALVEGLLLRMRGWPLIGVARWPFGLVSRLRTAHRSRIQVPRAKPPMEES